MKKSSVIKLVLVASIAASCTEKESDWADNGTPKKKVYMRSDTTASYSRTHYHGGILPYIIFRSYGSNMINNGFRRTGFYSDAIHPRSNAGTNASKSGIVRGGFGRSGFSRASS